MIINLYIEINRDGVKSEFERFVELEKHLQEQGFGVYNATDCDSCISGPNALTTLFDIEAAIEGK